MHTVYAVAEGQKFAGDSTLVVVECSQCHITYAIPESLKLAMLKWRGDKPNGWKTTCPMGHTWWYIGESKESRLQRELDEAERRRVATRDLLRAEERSHAATRGHLTRAKKRAHAGICPVPGCKRHFADLRRHMESKHPSYSDAPHAS
jgi:hypothetical protein